MDSNKSDDAGSSPAADPAPLSPDTKAFDEAAAPMVEELRSQKEKTKELYRPLLRGLLALGKSPQECYQRLRESKLTAQKASAFACLVRAADVAQDYLAGAIGYDKALSKARELYPTHYKKSDKKRRELAAQRLVALMMRLGRAEYRHPIQGVFRLTLKSTHLNADPPNESQEPV